MRQSEGNMALSQWSLTQFWIALHVNEQEEVLLVLRNKLLDFLWRSRNASFVWMATAVTRISAGSSEQVQTILADLGLGEYPQSCFVLFGSPS